MTFASDCGMVQWLELSALLRFLTGFLGRCPTSANLFGLNSDWRETSRSAFARGFGHAPADLRPFLEDLTQGEARIDGATHLMQHELKFPPVTLILALPPRHTPRGKMTPLFGRGAR